MEHRILYSFPGAWRKVGPFSHGRPDSLILFIVHTFAELGQIQGKQMTGSHALLPQLWVLTSLPW